MWRGDSQTRASRPDFWRARRSWAIVLRNRSGRLWLTRTTAAAQVGLPVRWADRIETTVRTVNVLVTQVRAGHRVGLVVIDRHLVLRKIRGLSRAVPCHGRLPTIWSGRV